MRLVFAALLALTAAAYGPAMAQEGTSDMLVIAHRGASAERPEHTLAAYERAIDQGADYIEIDLVPTGDGVLVARHENDISGTTDVDQRPDFAARLTTRVIEGQEITGWFTEDFTLAELQTLRARERMPEIRPANTAFDSLYLVPTLAEIITLVRAKEAETGRRIGIYAEIKHPAYFTGIGFDLAQMLVSQLHDAGYTSAEEPVFIQSFEVGPLIRLSSMTQLRLVQLVSASGGPADGDGTSYADMIDADGLAAVALYAHGIGPDMRLVLNADGTPTALVKAAHGAGLVVHAWTLRPENAFLPEHMRSGDDLSQAGCDNQLYAALAAAQIDGVFADSPARALHWRSGNANLLCEVIRPAAP